MKKIDKYVTTADGNKLRVEGIIGEGELQCVVHGTVTNIKVTNTFYIPELEGGIMSVPKLTEQNVDIVFQGKECIIMKDEIIESDGSERRSVVLLEMQITK